MHRYHYRGILATRHARGVTSRAAARAARNATHQEEFATEGYTVIPNALNAATTASLRTAIKKAVAERAKHIQELPKAVDVFKQQQDTPEPDPMQAKFMAKFKEVKRRKAEALRRKRLVRKAEREGKPHPFLGQAAAPTPTAGRSAAQEPKFARDATKDDVWEMAQKIAQQLVAVPAQLSSVYNDPARLKAINVHRCNTWMTDERVKAHVFGDVGKLLGRLAADVAGVQRPVLFADRPLVRDAFQRPTLFHCAAPLIGVQRHLTGKADGLYDPNARLTTCSAWVMLDDCAGLSSDFWVLRRSHEVVRRKLWDAVKRKGVDARDLTVEFAAMDSDVSYWLQKFPELEAGGEAVSVPLKAGSIVLCDPHLLAATGPNFTRHSHITTQFLMVSQTEAQPSVHPSSWVREWRAQSRHVDFGNGVIFPKLFDS
jgi:hypothetical protein